MEEIPMPDNKNRNRMRYRRMRDCRHCGGKFQRLRSDQIYCSANCRSAYSYHKTKALAPLPSPASQIRRLRLEIGALRAAVKFAATEFNEGDPIVAYDMLTRLPSPLGDSELVAIAVEIIDLLSPETFHERAIELHEEGALEGALH
jgi:hypothetical protein